MWLEARKLAAFFIFLLVLVFFLSIPLPSRVLDKVLRFIVHLDTPKLRRRIKHNVFFFFHLFPSLWRCLDFFLLSIGVPFLIPSCKLRTSAVADCGEVVYLFFGPCNSLLGWTFVPLCNSFLSHLYLSRMFHTRHVLRLDSLLYPAYWSLISLVQGFAVVFSAGGWVSQSQSQSQCRGRGRSQVGGTLYCLSVLLTLTLNWRWH